MFIDWTRKHNHEAGPGKLVAKVGQGADSLVWLDLGSDMDAAPDLQQNVSGTLLASADSLQAADTQTVAALPGGSSAPQGYTLATCAGTPVASSTTPTQVVFYISTTTPPPTPTTTPADDYSLASTSSPAPAFQLSLAMTRYSIVASTSLASSATGAPATSPLPATATPNATVSSGHASQALIIGAIVGSILGIVTLACLLFCLCRQRRKHYADDRHYKHGRSLASLSVAQQNASAAPEITSHATTLVHEPSQLRHHSISSWPSRLSSAILTPIRVSMRPISSSFPESRNPDSDISSSGSMRPSKATRLFSGVFLVPPPVTESAFSPSKEARELREGVHGEQPAKSPSSSNWPLRNSMPLRASYIDRVRAAERNEHQRKMFEAHHGIVHKEVSRPSIVYPPPTIFAPEQIGRGASEYPRPISFAAGPEYVVEDEILSSSPGKSSKY